MMSSEQSPCRFLVVEEVRVPELLTDQRSGMPPRSGSWIAVRCSSSRAAASEERWLRVGRRSRRTVLNVDCAGDPRALASHCAASLTPRGYDEVRLCDGLRDLGWSLGVIRAAPNVFHRRRGRQETPVVRRGSLLRRGSTPCVAAARESLGAHQPDRGMRTRG